MTWLPHLAARLFAMPLLIARPKLDVILAVLGSRLGLDAGTGGPEVGLVMPRSSAPAAAVSAPSGIAVLPIHGTLVRRTVGLEAESGLTSYTAIAAQLEAALADPAVQAILLDVDSPGGEAGGVFDLAERIRAATQVKPVWALANDLAFSAAYALASAASKVFVARTGGVGSIGVIAMHVDQSGKDAREGLRYTAVCAGEHKTDLNPHAPLSAAAHAVLQAEVDRLYDLFVGTVAAQRGLAVEAVRATEAGLFFGSDAVAAGLADAVGSFDAVLAELHSTVTAPTLALAGGGASFAVTQETLMSTTSVATAVAPTSAHAEAAAPTPSVVPAAPSAATPPVAALPSAVSPADPAPNPAPAAAVPPAIPMPIVDAVVIAETCQLAGRSDLIAGFLAAAATPAQVRRQLLAAQAEASPEITSRLDPGAHATPHPTSSDNPLLQAVRQRLAGSAVSPS